MENHHNEVSGRNLLITMVLNFIITAVEIIGGFIAGSLSLLSDALHNFSDGISVITSYSALKISKRENTAKKTFGYKRAEILAALFNSSLLLVITVFLFKAAYSRIIHPASINGGLMLLVASVGLIANTLSVLLLKHGSKESLNIKSTYLHLATDALSSFAIIIGGIFIHYFKFYWIDPVLTIIIGFYILRETYKIMKRTINILMEATPEDINISEIKTDIEKVPEVENLHHVHIWQLNDKSINFEGHINLCEDLSISQADMIRYRIETILLNKFGINHVTLQTEYNTCHDKDMIKKVKK